MTTRGFETASLLFDKDPPPRSVRETLGPAWHATAIVFVFHLHHAPDYLQLVLAAPFGLGPLADFPPPRMDDEPAEPVRRDNVETVATLTPEVVGGRVPLTGLAAGSAPLRVRRAWQKDPTDFDLDVPLHRWFPPRSVSPQRPQAPPFKPARRSRNLCSGSLSWKGWPGFPKIIAPVWRPNRGRSHPRCRSAIRTLHN